MTEPPKLGPLATHFVENAIELTEVHLAKRYELACFNEHMRKEVGYKGLSFENWMEVKIGEVQLKLKIK